VIVVKRGKPFAAVVPIRNDDEETVALANRTFVKIIDRSRNRAKKQARFHRANCVAVRTRKITLIRLAARAGGVAQSSSDVEPLNC
jgi:hypothetical protein